MTFKGLIAVAVLSDHSDAVRLGTDAEAAGFFQKFRRAKIFGLNRLLDNREQFALKGTMVLFSALAQPCDDIVGRVFDG